jgi:hemin uptake protein HemP
MPTTPPPAETRAAQSSTSGASLPSTSPAVRDVLRASDLLGARQVVEIEHNGQRYRLQATKAGKLILTK